MAGEDRLRDISALAANAHDALNALSAEEREVAPDDLVRLDAAIAYLSVALERTQPELLMPAVADELRRRLDEIVANPAGVAASPAASADGLIVQVTQLPGAQNRDFEQAVNPAATGFRRSTAQSLRGVRDSVTKLTADLDAIKTEFEAARKATDEANSATAKELEAQLQTILAEATTARNAVVALNAAQETEFKQAEEARAKTATDTWASTHTELREDADDLIADLARMRDETQGLVGSVSAATTANHYETDAKNERTAYWVLLAVTVASLAGAVIVAALAATHSEPDLQRLITKLGVSGALVALAVFTGARSRDHRDRAKLSRDKELEMRAFGPFIEQLPPKERVRERILMTRRFFGRAETGTPTPVTEPEIDLLSSPEEIEIAARDTRRRANTTQL